MKQRSTSPSPRGPRGLITPLLVSSALCGILWRLGRQPPWARLVVVLTTLWGTVRVSRRRTYWRTHPLQASAHLVKLAVAVLGPVYIALGVYRLLTAEAPLSGWAEVVFTVIACALIEVALTFFFPPPRPLEHVRGRRLLTAPEALILAGKALPAGDPGLFWGGTPIPSQAATTHFMVVGATGSGKTLTIRLLMQEVLPQIGQGHGHRAIIYDAKRDVLSHLQGMKLGCPIVTLHPFDWRCAAWDLAADITCPATARQVATILIPHEKHSAQPFFADAARHLLAGVLIALLKTAPGQWTLRDVLLILRSKERLRQVLELVPETQGLTQYFEPEHTFLCILSTLATKLAAYEFIAAAWSRAGTKLSLRQWLHEEYILVLGNDETTRSALDPLNRVLFRRLVELILNQPDSETRRTWVFLDEVREAGSLDGLSRLLTKGRSKGACVVLGFQDIEGLRDAYGERVAHEITGQCTNKAILRLESPQTAQWATEVIGAAERLEYRDNSSVSVGHRGGTAGHNTAEQLIKREVILPSEFMEFPPTDRTNGLTGIYVTPYTGAYSATLSPGYLTAALRPRAEDVPDLVERPEEHQYLFGWTSGDLARLGLPVAPEPSPEPPSPKPRSRLALLKGIGREP
jgi:hypothetical protein